MEAEPDPILSRRSFVRNTAAAALTTFTWNRGLQAAEPEVAGTFDAPLLTPAEDFYTVARGNPKPHTLQGKALAEAGLTPETWRLEVKANPFVNPPDIKKAAQLNHPLLKSEGSELSLPDLLKLGEAHEVRYIKAMQCLNIAEPLGQGLWEGVPLREVLRLAGPMDNVRRIYYRGFHNHDPEQIFQSSLSYTQVMETPPGELPVFLAYRLNGQPIPPVRGGPVRVIVPWAHGFKSIKWVQEIFVTNDYQANDTYALRNNDPESYLKTAAYVDGGPDQYQQGQAVTVTGQVISGLSGLERVECWLRKDVPAGGPRLEDDDPALREGPWQPCKLLPPPLDWSSVLPPGVASKSVLGFDPQSGQPTSWPLRYGMAWWMMTLPNLPKGRYELYARAVDRNGFAQPEPRPTRRSGKNAIQFQRFEVL